MVSAYNTPWVICTKYVLSNYFTTLGTVYLYAGRNDYGNQAVSYPAFFRF